jgi:hypothetical protein
MKKNSWLLYLLASGLILASCNKDNLPAPESKKTPTEKSQGGTADQPQDPAQPSCPHAQCPPSSCGGG